MLIETLVEWNKNESHNSGVDDFECWTLAQFHLACSGLIRKPVKALRVTDVFQVSQDDMFEK